MSDNQLLCVFKCVRVYRESENERAKKIKCRTTTIRFDSMPQFFLSLYFWAKKKHFLLMWEHVKTILLACFIVFWVPSWVLRQKFIKICEFYFVVTWHASFFSRNTHLMIIALVSRDIFTQQKPSVAIDMRIC